MRTVTTKTDVYQFQELSEEAKQKALEQMYDINVHYNWWHFVYEDAEEIGLILSTFDLGRSRDIDGSFKWSAEECAELITKNHGKDCETYKTAASYLIERGELVTKYSNGVDTDKVSEGNEYDFDCECDDLDNDFLYSLLQDYFSLLNNEYDYLTSEEAIIESIEANEYEFTKDGKLF